MKSGNEDERFFQPFHIVIIWRIKLNYSSYNVNDLKTLFLWLIHHSWHVFTASAWVLNSVSAVRGRWDNRDSVYWDMKPYQRAELKTESGWDAERERNPWNISGVNEETGVSGQLEDSGLSQTAGPHVEQCVSDGRGREQPEGLVVIGRSSLTWAALPFLAVPNEAVNSISLAGRQTRDSSQREGD